MTKEEIVYWLNEGGSNSEREAANLIDSQQKRIEELEKDYYELLYAVARKVPNETRHQTALRYIQQMEERCIDISSGEKAIDAAIDQTNQPDVTDKDCMDWLEKESAAKTNLGALYPTFGSKFKTHNIRQAINAAINQTVTDLKASTPSQ
jgi:hypothetical protein